VVVVVVVRSSSWVQSHGVQTRAFIKRRFANARDGGWQVEREKARAHVERRWADGGQRFW